MVIGVAHAEESQALLSSPLNPPNIVFPFASAL